MKTRDELDNILFYLKQASDNLKTANKFITINLISKPGLRACIKNTLRHIAWIVFIIMSIVPFEDDKDE